ncbi:HHL018Cp [Eremothecium sinecaudum]|uniref:Nucleolar protein 9 n=1 Tax=Eremothecium sinecaudum TaxID=45286 RepID=A0A0X8HWH5_9SACH|nr:HHL018Cp [Eremothecium sinecaudum]AMD22752.1 HHL018Cp [Eremothecium sinecaudum]
MAKQRGRNLLKKQQKNEFAPSTDGNHHDDISLNAEVSSKERTGEPNMFFGTLDVQELEYFKQAESTLAVDTFESEEDKVNFISTVIEESKGKELKLATSQICSKLMERIILETDDRQVKEIFQKFNGFFFNISCHKYASHVLETLLVRSAALVERELLTPTFDDTLVADNDGVFTSMENLFLFMVNELKPNLRMMITHQYASHVLRLLILILSSKKLPSSTQNNSTLRSKKSKIARKMVDLKDSDDFNKVFRTPDSFKSELKTLLSTLYKELTNGVEIGLENRCNISPSCITKVREQCIDKVASPVYQLIIQVEGIFDRDRSFWHLVFSNTEEKDPKEESFVEYLLSDSVGSHFLQTVIGFSRVKYVERLYRLYMQDRIVKLAKRETTGAYVVQSLLKTLHQNEVRKVINDLVPELSILLNSNIDFATEIIDASISQGNYKKNEIIEQLIEKYYPDNVEDRNILESCLQLSSSTLGNTRDDWPTATERRKALFLERLIDLDDKFLNITIDSLLALPEERMLQMCYHGVFSHVVERVLQVGRVETVKRKLLLNIFCKDIVNMACNAYGSHIMDKLWEFTCSLTLYKERIASALTSESTKVKNSVYGRQVWKNWHLEQYNRKMYEWRKILKDQEADLLPNVKKLQAPQKADLNNKRAFVSSKEDRTSKKRNING